MQGHDDHLLRARIVGVFAGQKSARRSRITTAGHRVANHGIVACSCGWSSGEQISLPQAARIAQEQHPEGVTEHARY